MKAFHRSPLQAPEAKAQLRRPRQQGCEAQEPTKERSAACAGAFVGLVVLRESQQVEDR